MPKLLQLTDDYTEHNENRNTMHYKNKFNDIKLTWPAELLLEFDC